MYSAVLLVVHCSDNGLRLQVILTHVFDLNQAWVLRTILAYTVQPALWWSVCLWFQGLSIKGNFNHVTKVASGDTFSSHQTMVWNSGCTLSLEILVYIFVYIYICICMIKICIA